MLSRAENGTGFFSTRGNEILDADGHAVRIAAVNWYGLETRNASPDGLFQRNWMDMMDQMKSLGFNTIRLPYSSELLEGGLAPVGIDYGRNPDLQGLSGVQFIDKIVDYAGQIGLRIILDRHRGPAGDGPNGGGLWYDGRYSEQDWIDDWQMLAARYKGNATVIGADLHNEPHAGASWAAWSAAAERAGAAIQAVNPDWLILVEGVEIHNGDWYWWGGNLQGAATDPVVLPVANKLVYSPHDYPNSVYGQPWFNDPNFPGNLHEVFQKQWGYLSSQGIAPILLGEFGSKLEGDSKDWAWLDVLIRALNGDANGDGVTDPGAPAAGLSWAWWSWNPSSGDTGGILSGNWSTPIAAKIQQLQRIAGQGFVPNQVLHATDGISESFAGGPGVDTLLVGGVSAGWAVLRRGDDVFLVNRATGETDHGRDIEQIRFGDNVLVKVTALHSSSPLEYVASHADLMAAFGTDAAAGWTHLLRHGLAEHRAIGFDGLSYIASHADLSAAFGADEEAGARHFIQFGRLEGRAAGFDSAAYLASYDDLRAVFGRDAEAAAGHYITTGRAEGRSITFDGLRYAASYDDLSLAFGTDQAGATAHFLDRARIEGRSASFDPLTYIASHRDLTEAIGTDARQGTLHWLHFGVQEHRARAGFDAAQYLENYADLRAAFGDDLQAATRHYIERGLLIEHRTDDPLG
ncbi:glycoside hydrolase family 5 protein [Pseudoroseomonas sp. WGS1072]|uniref:glycoside hydrolase family 5 protein n=1 Tax=Roseomonas sp. WGS1072 TaxID=3366816 RepID=UPI003BF28B57